MQGCVTSLTFFRKILKPWGNGHSEALLTLGDHIRSVRLERKLLQREVADIIGVSCDTVENWEANRTRPVISHMPGVTKFLGYCMVEYVPNSIAGQALLNFRIQQGLSINKMGKRIGVDDGSIRTIELGRLSYKKTRNKITAYLKKNLDACSQVYNTNLGIKCRIKRI